MTTQLVLRDLDDNGVLLLTWNRPERNNGWTVDLENEYFEALIEAARNPVVRVIVVTGAGNSFCPGLDMRVLAGATEGVSSAGDRKRWPLTLVRRIPKPVISAINGACAGIGLIQAVASDLRFASTAAKFTAAFPRRGLPTENSLSWMLPRLVGTGNAMDLLLSGRVVAAEEAQSLGLVNRVVEPDRLLDTAIAYARDMAANCSPRSMAAAKQQVHADWERTSEESRLQALVHVADLTGGPDFREGVSSFVEKRPPSFEGLSVEVNIPKGWYR